MRKLLLIVSLCVFAFNVSAGDDFKSRVGERLGAGL